MTSSQFRAGLVAIVAVLYLAMFFYLDRWPSTLYYGDSSHYYLHVVSAFVNQDVGNYDQTISSLIEANPASRDARQDEFGIRMTEKGRYYIKYTLGVPVFETPLFVLGHAYASISQTYEANGWSKPYLLAVGMAPIFYICIGFWLLSGVFLRYFSRRVTALTVIAVAMATNLLYQGTYVVMAHGFLFFAHCMLIYLTVRFYDAPSRSRALLIGLTTGLIAITRVPEIICALVPLLWGVQDKASMLQRIRLFRKTPSYLLLSALGFLAVFSLQMAYWHYVSGQLLFDPYKGEGIDLLNPKLHKGWLDYSNGWLIYTPIMIFSLVGLWFMRGKSRDALVPILFFVLSHAYIHYSYYAWTYFPGLGQRPMVETYPLLAFGLAAFCALLTRSKWISWVPIAMIMFFGWLNVFQTWQSNEGIIWTERGNKPFYYATFGKTTSSLRSFRSYDTNAAQPDTSKIRYVNTLFYEDFETLSGPERSEEQAFSGNASLLSKTYDSEWSIEFPLDQIDGRDWLRIAVKAFFEADQVPAHRDHCTQFVIELYDDTDKRRRYRSMAITSHIGNDEGSIWTSGIPGMWDDAMFYFQLPRKLDGWRLKAFVRSTHGQKVYVDDVLIERFKKP